MTVRVVNWNAEWASPKVPRGKEICRRIMDHKPDVICLTEAPIDFLPDEGFLICSDADYGYKAPPKRRKVTLWSRSPWEDIQTTPVEGIPSGRFVTGRTDTPDGNLLFVGICIPWEWAHVSTGHKNRQRWEDHLLYLEALDTYLQGQELRETVVLGDFNQRIPKARASVPEGVYQRLLQVFDGRLTIATGGPLSEEGECTLDHIAHSSDLNLSQLNTLPKETEDGKHLTDHLGVVGTLRRE